MGQLSLDTPIQFVKGVGPVRAQQLGQLGVSTLEDLLTYFPRRYDFRRQVQPISALKGDEDAATVAGEVKDVTERRYGSKPFLQCLLDDGDGWVFVKWFHGGYLRDRIRPGVTLAVSGKVSVFQEYLQFVNPRHQVIHDPQGTNLNEDELLPVYPASGQLSSPIIAGIIKKVLPAAMPLIRDCFDREYLSQRGMMDRSAAIAAMHRPEDKEQWGQARRRLAYDECMLMQTGLALARLRQVSRPAHALELSPEIDSRIRARFPFAMTAAQDKAVAEIAADLARSRPMNRLLQGDVGSGKTVVALHAALLAVARGRQAAIMAPTEILATQHFRKVQQYLDGSKVRVAMLTGNSPPIERARILDGLARGTVNIVIGTHALIGDGVAFASLALVVVDEQHKFGVRQRAGFRGKGFAPHYLVMTATPIPRTLAMTVFGDLDVSTIDALPPGRGKTVTRVSTQEKLPAIMQLVRQRLKSGQQAYFIYPLVNASPDLELTAAEDAYRDLTHNALKGFRVGMIHGQMPGDRKDAVMSEFRAGHVQALVASVVVEVGVDVPNANLMVVMHAERFGLAQLHQLRGRIGRSEQDAECILVASPDNPLARERLKVLEKTSDGFKLAEEDLRIRGPGELFGTRQHGLPDLKVADLIEDFELLRLARRDAFALVNQDRDLSLPHHQQLRGQVIRAYGGKLGLVEGA